jgi:hypothetical protein
MPTTNTNISLQIYSEKVILGLRRALAAIFAFSLDLSNEAARIGQTIRVPLITANAAGDWNASTNNYKASKDDLHDISVALDKRKIAKFGIDDEQAANYHPSWWERKAEANVNAVAAAALDDIFGAITPANCAVTSSTVFLTPSAPFFESGPMIIRPRDIAVAPNANALKTSYPFSRPQSTKIGIRPSTAFTISGSTMSGGTA